MPVVSAKHHCTKPCHNRPGMTDKGNLLSNNAAIIDWQVGQVSCRVFSVDVIRDGIEYLPLRKRSVIRDVIDIARGLLMIGSQQEALHHIGDVAKWHRIVSSPNNYSLAILYALTHATKVQAISWAEEGTRTNDHCLHITFEHEASHQAITFRLGNAVGIWIRSQWLLLSQEPAIAKSIDSMRTGMNETAHTCCLSCPVEILGARDIHEAIICKWTIHTHHACQVKDNVNILDCWGQCAGIRDIPSHHLHSLGYQLLRVFYRQDQRTNLF